MSIRYIRQLSRENCGNTACSTIVSFRKFHGVYIVQGSVSTIGVHDPPGGYETMRREDLQKKHILATIVAKDENAICLLHSLFAQYCSSYTDMIILWLWGCCVLLCCHRDSVWAGLLVHVFNRVQTLCPATCGVWLVILGVGVWRFRAFQISWF